MSPNLFPPYINPTCFSISSHFTHLPSLISSMAPTKISLFLFSSFLIFISFSHALPRDHIFHVFDVSTSIAKTRQLFSHKTLPKQVAIDKLYDVVPANSSTFFSVPLHPRLSISKNPHNTYHELTLSRLARDSVRVNSIYKQLKLEPVEKPVQPNGLETPVTSGVKHGSGEYFARIGVGQPVRSYYMAIDTGSDITWLQCEPCADCYQQADPVFNPSTSSTYRPVKCASPQCNSLRISACASSGCLYQVAYGDGSFTVGNFATEMITFGNSGRVENTAIGCGHDNEGLFTGSAGLLGIGGGPLSLTSQIKATSFSYCLVNRDSTAESTLEFNSAPPGDSVVASLVRNPKNDIFFYVDLIGITVAGEKLPIPESSFQMDGDGHGGVIVDSGTAVTRFKTEIYNSLRDTFVKYTRNLRKAEGYSLFDTCYDLSSMTKALVPKVAFIFAGGKALTLNAENYLLPVHENGKFCLAFATSELGVNIIGNVQQQSTRVSYDLANKHIAFSTNSC